MGRVELDSKDLKLLGLLKQDGRAPYSRLAAELKISESAVRKRIARLKKIGVIKRFTVEYEVPGEATAVILVKTQPPTPTPEVSKAIVRYKHVDKVYEITGEYDILVIVKASSILDINSIIDYIRSIRGVVGTQTSIVLRSY